MSAEQSHPHVASVAAWVRGPGGAVPTPTQRQPGHPAWCSQGPHCYAPSAGGGVEGDSIVEWVHCTATYFEHSDGRAQVATERFDTLHDDDRHEVDQVVFINADGTFTARQAEAFARAILAAVEAVDVGLEGTPGGLPAVLAQLPQPWPPPRV